MEEKKRFFVKKDSVLPYLAAAMGAIMLILSFFVLFTAEGKFHISFNIPVFRWTWSSFKLFRIRFVFLDSLLLLTAVMLVLAGAGLAKKTPLFCALPSLPFLLFLIVWTGVIGFSHLDLVFAGWNSPLLLLSLAVGVLSILTVCGVIRTKLPMAIVSFAATLLLLIALFTIPNEFNGYLTPFCDRYLLSPVPDRFMMLRFLCLFLGTGFLALSLEYGNAPQEQKKTGVSAGAWPSQDQPRQLGGLPSCLAERRSVAVCILLSFVTFGIYLIYWKYTLCKKIRAWCGEPENCAGETACLVLVPFYSFYWMYTRGKKIYNAFCARGLYAQDNSVTYLLLDIFCLGIVSYGLLQNEFNKIADYCNGQPSFRASVPAAVVAQPMPRPSPSASSVEKTVEERLMEVQSLLDKGIITQEEFEKKRQDILEDL